MICVDTNIAEARKVVSSIVEAGGAASAVQVDLANDDAVTKFAQSGSFPVRLDQLALCAGIYDPTPVEGFALDRYRRVVDTNLTGAVQLLASLVPALKASPHARVVTISSIQGFLGEAGSSAYAISKAGLIAATRVLSAELAVDGILVNSVAPGFIETPMAIRPDGTDEHETQQFQSVYVAAGKLPLGRPGTADEVARAVLFLLDPLNTYITGHVLVVDGGLTATF